MYLRIDLITSQKNKINQLVFNDARIEREYYSWYFLIKQIIYDGTKVEHSDVFILSNHILLVISFYRENYLESCELYNLWSFTD